MSIKTQCISPYFSFLLRLLKAFNDFNIVKAIVTLVDFYTVEKKKKKRRFYPSILYTSKLNSFVEFLPSENRSSKIIYAESTFIK